MRVLAFDPKGNLIAGSDGSGLVYRISPAGEGFVLYSAPKGNHRAGGGHGGNIHAAGKGEKRGHSRAFPVRPYRRLWLRQGTARKRTVCGA
jgi:hypothetical protein